MASFNSYTGNGSTTNRAITFPYIDQSHVHVYLDGVESEDWTWFDSSTIQFNTAPANGVAILIQRETPVSERLAEFTNGEALLDEELNVSSLQSLYAAEEAKDRAEQSIAVNSSGVYDFNNRRGTNVAAPTGPGDAVNKAYADTIIDQTTDLMTAAEGFATAAETAATAAEAAEDNTATLLAAADAAKVGAEDARDEAVAAAAALDTSLYLTKADNLNSVADKPTARGNLGLAALATKDTIDSASLLGADVVETAKIKDANVTTDKLAANAVTHAKLRVYESGQQTWTSAGALTLAHGLGAVPKLCQAFIVCISADSGYSAGAEVPLGHGFSTYDAKRGLSMHYDNTNIYIRFGSGVDGADAARIPNGATGADVGFTHAKWKLIVRAYA